MLRVEYSWEIEQLNRDEAIEKVQVEFEDETEAAKDKIIDQLRGELNQWVDHIGEVFIEKFMADHFRDQIVDGAIYFNLARQIQLSRFTRVFRTTVQPYGATHSSQIDLYALPSDLRALPWAVEVKNWQNPVTKPKVVHFWEAAQNLADDKGHGEMICWFHARSGFMEPAREFMQEKGILSTDEATLAQMLRDFRVVERWREG